MATLIKVKKLIKIECAGYYFENNYCCTKDGECIFFLESEKLPCCKYFEKGVLPLDIDLEFEYRVERKMNVGNKTSLKTNVKCDRCNLFFEAVSNRQVYCEKCKKIIKRENNRLTKKKSRESGLDVTL